MSRFRRWNLDKSFKITGKSTSRCFSLFLFAEFEFPIFVRLDVRFARFRRGHRIPHARIFMLTAGNAKILLSDYFLRKIVVSCVLSQSVHGVHRSSQPTDEFRGGPGGRGAGFCGPGGGVVAVDVVACASHYGY